MILTIVPAQANDLTALLALLKESSLPTAGIAEHLSTTVLAHDGERLVGSAALELYGTDGLLRSVAVIASLRGQGLGEQLTHASLELARHEDVQRLYLLTETAQEYFPRFGFRRIERSAVSSAIHASVEWEVACPTNAQAMVLQLNEV